MKRIILMMVLGAGISGCASNVPQYDNNEYASVVSMKVTALDINRSCHNNVQVYKSLQVLEKDALYFNVYSKHLPDNEKVYEISNILKKIVNEMYTRYHRSSNISLAYCEQKSYLIIQGIDRTLDAVANKYRIKDI